MSHSSNTFSTIYKSQMVSVSKWETDEDTKWKHPGKDSSRFSGNVLEEETSKSSQRVDRWLKSFKPFSS